MERIKMLAQSAAQALRVRLHQSILLVGCLLFAACHTVDKYEWIGPGTLKGDGGIMKVENDLEIWVMGEPQRNYVPLKVVETTTSGSIGVETYLFRVLKGEAKKLGGDGFILLSKYAQTSGFVSSGVITTTGSIYGNTYSAGSTTFGTVSVVPVRYNTYRALVFRYEE